MATTSAQMQSRRPRGRQRQRQLGHVPLSSGEIELYTQQDEAARRRRRLLAVREQERRLAQQVTRRYRANLSKLRGGKAQTAQREWSREQEALLSELHERYQRSLQGMGTAQRNAREKLLQLMEQAQLEQSKWVYNRGVAGKQRVEEAEHAREADDHARLARRREVEENLARLRELSAKQRAHASAHAKKEQEEKLRRAEEAEKAERLRRLQAPEEVFVTPRPHAKDVVSYQYTRAHCVAAPPAPVAPGTSRPAVTVIRHNTRHPAAKHGEDEARKYRDEMDQKRERDRLMKEENDDKAAGRGEEALRGDESRQQGQQALEWLALVDRRERRERGQVLGDGEYHQDAVLSAEDDAKHPQRMAELAFARMFGLDEDSVELSSFSIETEGEELPVEPVDTEQQGPSSAKTRDEGEYRVKLRAAKLGESLDSAELLDGEVSADEKLKHGDKWIQGKPGMAGTPSKASPVGSLEMADLVKAKTGKEVDGIPSEEAAGPEKQGEYEEDPVDGHIEKKTPHFAFGSGGENEAWRKTTTLSSERSHGMSGRGEDLPTSHGYEPQTGAYLERSGGRHQPAKRSMGAVEEAPGDTMSNHYADLQVSRGRDSIEQLETRLQEVLNLRAEQSRLDRSSVDSSQRQANVLPASSTRIESGRHRDLLHEAEMRLLSWGGRGAPPSRSAGSDDSEVPNTSVVSLPVASIDSGLSLSADSGSLTTAEYQLDNPPARGELLPMRGDLSVKEHNLDASASSSRAEARSAVTLASENNDDAGEVNSPGSSGGSSTRNFRGQGELEAHVHTPSVASSIGNGDEHAGRTIHGDSAAVEAAPRFPALGEDDDHTSDRTDARSMLSSMAGSVDEYDEREDRSLSSHGSPPADFGDRSAGGHRLGAGSRLGSIDSHSEMSDSMWLRDTSAQQGDAKANYGHEGSPRVSTKTPQATNESVSEHEPELHDGSDHSISRRSSISSHRTAHKMRQEAHYPSSQHSSLAHSDDGNLSSSRSSFAPSEQVTARRGQVNSGRVMQQRVVEEHMLSFSSSEAQSESGDDLDISAHRPSISDGTAPPSVKYGPDDRYRQQIEHEARERSTSSSSIPQYSLPLSESLSSFDDSFDETHPGVGEDSFVNELVPLFPKPKLLQQQRAPEGEDQALQQYDVQLDAPNMNRMLTGGQLSAPGLHDREYQVDKAQQRFIEAGSAHHLSVSSRGSKGAAAYPESEQKAAGDDAPSSSRRSSSEASGYKVDPSFRRSSANRPYENAGSRSRRLDSTHTADFEQPGARHSSIGDERDAQDDEAADLRSEPSESDSGVSSLGFSAQLHLAAGIVRRRKSEADAQRGATTGSNGMPAGEGSKHSGIDAEDDRHSHVSEKSFDSGSSLSMDAHFNYLVNMTAAVGKSLPLHLRLPAMVYGKTDMTKPPGPIAWSSSSPSSPAASEQSRDFKQTSTTSSRMEERSDAHSSSSESLEEQVVLGSRSLQRRRESDREQAGALQQSAPVNRPSRSSDGSRASASASASESEPEETITLEAMKQKVATLPPPPLGSLNMSQPPAPLQQLSGGLQASISSVRSFEGSEDAGGRQTCRNASGDLHGAEEDEHKAGDSNSDSGVSSLSDAASVASSSNTRRHQRSKSSERLIIPMQEDVEGGDNAGDKQEVSLAEAFQRRHPGFHRRVESHRDRLKRQKDEQRKQQREQQQLPPRHPQATRYGSLTRASTGASKASHSPRGGTAEAPLSKQQQELMDRLATGARAKMSSHEMKERSRRLYHQLPEVVERKRQEEMLRRRRQRLDELREQEKARRQQQKERRQRQIQQQPRR